MVLLAHPLLGPFDRQPVIAGEGFHPGLVVGGPLAQDLLADDRNADHLTEEVHDLLGARETAEVAVNDNGMIRFWTFLASSGGIFPYGDHRVVGKSTALLHPIAVSAM